MINIKKYFTSAFVVYALTLAILLVISFVCVQLTKHRIQIESQNKLINLVNKQSYFVWDFDDFEADVVESFQSYWQHGIKESSYAIKAPKANNPQLSLNFSGEAINANLHQIMRIESNNPSSTSFTIQFKTDLDDSIYYYSPIIKLRKAVQDIDLTVTWQGINNINKQTVSTKWGADNAKVVSLVLHFKNPNEDLLINKISLPYTGRDIKIEYHDISCKGVVIDEIKPQVHNVFTLNENCWLPSNYMWLKNYVQQKYPESLLSIDKKIDLTTYKQEQTAHRINKHYTNISSINSGLYVVIAVVLLFVFFARKKYQHIKPVTEEIWYKWLGKQLVFKGASKVITPYHFVMNYALVLVPTLILLLIMAAIKLPTLESFKHLPMYFLWALVQQFILCYVLAQRVFYNYTQHRLISCILSGLVFSLFHLPSVTLMLATFIAGCYWSYMWLLFKRLIPLAIAHSVLALMFYYVISERFLYSAKVLQWFWE